MPCLQPIAPTLSHSRRGRASRGIAWGSAFAARQATFKLFKLVTLTRIANPQPDPTVTRGRASRAVWITDSRVDDRPRSRAVVTTVSDALRCTFSIAAICAE